MFALVVAVGADDMRAIYIQISLGEIVKLIRWAVILGSLAMIAGLATGQNAPNAYEAAKRYAANPYYSSVPTTLPNPYQEVEKNWFRLPPGMGWAAMDAPAIDSHGNVWAMTRCRA